MNPQEILAENKVFIIRSVDNKIWCFEYKGKIIPQPEPWRCYQVLIDQFEITEPRLKDFRK